MQSVKSVAKCLVKLNHRRKMCKNNYIKYTRSIKKYNKSISTNKTNFEIGFYEKLKIVSKIVH